MKSGFYGLATSVEVCFSCRVSFKETSVCPICRGVMVNMGKRFKAPRKEAVTKWKQIEKIVKESPLSKRNSKIKALKVNKKRQLEAWKKASDEVEYNAQFKPWSKKFKKLISPSGVVYKEIPVRDLKAIFNRKVTLEQSVDFYLDWGREYVEHQWVYGKYGMHIYKTRIPGYHDELMKLRKAALLNAQGEIVDY